MLQVIPLRYGTVFKKAFGDREVFSRFASDVLGIPIDIPVVHTEYSYPEAVGRVRVEYDLFGEDPVHRVIVEMQHIRAEEFFDRFLHYHLVGVVEQAANHADYRVMRDVYTLVVLTTEPREKHLRFSVAVSDMDPVNEQGARLGVYRHRLVFLNPKVINDKTPPRVRSWLELIAESLGGEVDETRYPDPLQQRVIQASVSSAISPAELARIKDESSQENSMKSALADVARANVLLVLATRGLTLTDAQRERVERCADLGTLTGWLQRAVLAAVADDMFG
jgi:hypothetical protein